MTNKQALREAAEKHGDDDILAMLDELEAKNRMIAELLNTIGSHTVELGWGEKPITLAELIISREGSGSDVLDAIRTAGIRINGEG